MRVGLAYLSVVLIWSTTPMGIKLSNSSLTFITALTLRMCIGLALCWLVLVALRRPLVQSKKDWWVYLVGGFGLFPNMIIVYWSAQFIPSGLVSVVMGVYPFLVGLFSIYLLKENVFTSSKIIALCIAIIGLVFIHVEQMSVGPQAIYGVLGILVSAVLFGLSSVCLKAIGSDIDPLRQATGSLVVATPAFIVTWFVMDGHIPSEVESQSLYAVIYLAVAGTLIGHTLFFYVLKHCSVSTVSLITLITPIMALAIGYFILKEDVSWPAITGSGLIIFSLAIYQGLYKRFLPLSEHRIKRIFQSRLAEN